MSDIRCLIVDDEPTAREIIRLHLEQLEGIEIVALCKNGAEVLGILDKHKVDLILLDINMPDMSGISLAHSIPKTIKVIFTTAYREYAIDGFDLQAVDYLLKPISFDRLDQAIKKYQTEHVPKNDLMNYLVVRSDRKMVKVDLNDIWLIESFSDYLKIRTSSKTIVTRETISGMEKKLPKELFVRIHRSFIVSIPSISSYTAEHVEINDQMISISRSYRNSFLEIISKE